MLGIYSAGKNYALLINAQPEFARIHLTTHSKKNPIKAPNFCMLLRKHLIGARISSIITYDLERIMELNFETYDELSERVIKKIIVQVMASGSNIILAKQNNTIIDSIKRVDTTDVQILPSKTYKLPNNIKQSFLEINSFEEYENILNYKLNDPIDKALSDSFIGISRNLVQSLKLDGINLYKKLKELTNNIGNVKLVPYENDYTVLVDSSKENLDVNFFLDDFYYTKEKAYLFKQKRSSLLAKISNQLKKYSKRLENINEKLDECKDMEQYRIYGELITSNLYKYSSKENLDSIIVQNYYDNQNEISIHLDKKYSLRKNAERYFKKYNKLKNTLKIVGIQKKETEIELEYVQSVLFSIENATCLEELNDIENELDESSIFDVKFKNQNNNSNKKKALENQSKPVEFNIDGFTVLIGKNNKQNDLLTLKIASKTDLWFHVQKTQGSHVILKCESKKVPENIILECANLARIYSKAKESKNVAVDYCPVKNVKKPSGAKPGMVIYNDYKTIIIN